MWVRVEPEPCLMWRWPHRKRCKKMGKQSAKTVSHVASHGAKTVSNVASHGAKTVSSVATSIAKPVQNMGNHLLHRKQNQQQQQVDQSAHRRHNHHIERKNSEDSDDRRSRRSSRSSASTEEGGVGEEDRPSGEFESAAPRRKKKAHRAWGRTKSETGEDVVASVSENSTHDEHQNNKDQPGEEHAQNPAPTVEGKVQESDESARMSRRSSWYNPTSPWETEEEEVEALQHLRTLPIRAQSCDAVMEHGMMMPGKLTVERKKKKRLTATARHNADHEDNSDDDDDEEEDRRRGCLIMSSLPSHSLSNMLSSNFGGPDGKDQDDDDEHSVSSWCNIDTSDSEWDENEEGPVQQSMAPSIASEGSPAKNRPRAARAAASASLLSNAGLLDNVMNHEDASEADDSEEEDLLFSTS
mmetsp:Transcript_1108/g.2356  ORF Transcript_1108/g.2356 Transcript_1108/m.2356 type:complete len:412 (-) Transcript_1108:696-1931(-)